MKVHGRRKRGRTKRRWLDKVKDDIKEKGQSADEVYDLLHGGVCHRAHESGNMINRKKTMSWLSATASTQGYAVFGNTVFM